MSQEPPSFTGRKYQEDMLDRVRSKLVEHKRVLAQAPTGAGKTVLASFMVQASSSKGLRCYFIVHRQELIDQTALTFERMGLCFSFIAAGYPYDPSEMIQICSMDTVVRRVTDIDAPDLVIVDEAHHAVARTWSTVLECWPEAYVVGLTATPERLDGRGLAKHFNALVDGPSVFDLITQGWLSEYKMIAPPIGVDTSGLKTVAGDFNRKELGELMDDADLIGSIVDHWEKYAKGLKTMGFAVNVKHSRHIVEAFIARGHRAVHLDAKTPKRQRRQILREFAEGLYDVVFNVGLFGEGFDLEANANSGREPGTPYLEVSIEAVISARPTQSLSIWLQQVGRALRPKPQPAVILDHAGNVWVHGLPDADRAWSLHSKKRKKGVAPVKQCPNCYAVVPSASMVCPLCEYAWPPPEGREVDHQAGELVVLDIDGMRQRRLDEIEEYRADNEACETYMQLVELATKRGSRWPHRWAQHQWEKR